MKTELSFVIIEYNCIEETFRCVKRIREIFNGISYEIIVSSNSCYAADKQDYIRNHEPHIKWIFNRKNRGFSAGMNAGIVNSKGEILVLLNPDVYILKFDYSSIISYIKSNSRLGLLGPKIVDSNGELQDSCRPFLSLTRLAKRQIVRLIYGKENIIEEGFNYDTMQKVDWVIGAFMVLKARVLNVVGLFDERYFLYVEDMDLCKRIWNSGFEVQYFPEIVVSYKGTRSSTKKLIGFRIVNRYLYHHVKSYLIFILKNKFRNVRNEVKGK